MEQRNLKLAQDVIAELGGTKAVALECKITPGAVSQWIQRGIPPLREELLHRDHPDLDAWHQIAKE